MPRGKNLRPEAGAGTRFGQPGGPNPRAATKNGPPKWSIRKALAHMAAQEVDPNDRNAMRNLLGKNPTLAQVIAAAALTKASKGDMAAVNYATENIDGKLPQTNINAEYEAIKDASDEELDAIIRTGLGQQAGSGDGNPGAQAPSGSEGDGMDAISRPSKRSPKKCG
jgi:hypothetical protein